MAKNLRAKLPKEDTLVIHDINTAALSKFKQESGSQSVHVAENVREVAEKSVRRVFSRHTLHSRDEHVLSMI